MEEYNVKLDFQATNSGAIVCNAIKDIMTHGCSSLSCSDCPLYNQMPGTIEEKLCAAINQC